MPSQYCTIINSPNVNNPPHYQDSNGFSLLHFRLHKIAFHHVTSMVINVYMRSCIDVFICILPCCSPLDTNIPIVVENYFLLLYQGIYLLSFRETQLPLKTLYNFFSRDSTKIPGTRAGNRMEAAGSDGRHVKPTTLRSLSNASRVSELCFTTSDICSETAPVAPVLSRQESTEIDKLTFS